MTAARPAQIGRHILFFIVVIVVMTAVAIWLGIGPVVLSR